MIYSLQKGHWIMLGKSVILIHFFIEFLIVSTVILEVDEWAIDIR